MYKGKAEAVTLVLALLRDVAADIQDSEKWANEALIRNRDYAQYRAHYENKALLLSRLPGMLKILVEGLTPEALRYLDDETKRLALEANVAIAKGSVHAMEVLLYPKGYSSGDPNELERLIQWLEAD